MKRLSGTSYLVAAASLALLLSACGGGDSDADARPTSDANDTDASPQIDAMPSCTAIPLEGVFALTGGNADVLQFNDNITTDLGDGGEVQFQFEVYNGLQPGPLTGTFELDEGIDANYMTCASCLRVFSLNAAGDELVRQFFQTGGSVTYTEDPFTRGLMILIARRRHARRGHGRRDHVRVHPGAGRRVPHARCIGRAQHHSGGVDLRRRGVPGRHGLRLHVRRARHRLRELGEPGRWLQRR